MNSILKKTLDRLTGLWEGLKGDIDSFSLQARIYHSVCIATILVMVYVVIFSFLNALLVTGLATMLIIPVQLLLFYLSRYRNKTSLSFSLYGLLIYVFFIFSYRVNDGVSGSSMLSFLSVYFLSLAIAEQRHYWLWTLSNLFVVISLIICEFTVVGFVHYTYENDQQRMIDLISTYVVTVILLLACISYIISNYRKERQKVEVWAAELDRLHDEKSQLIEIISHDYQTPLHSIKHYLDILRKYEIGGQVRRDMENELSQTLANTQNLLLNLLEPTKRVDVAADWRTNVDISTLLSPILAVYSPIAMDKDVELLTGIPDNLQIWSNRSSLSVVLRNMVNNAVKYTPKGGWIRLSHENREKAHVLFVSNSAYIADPFILREAKACFEGGVPRLTTLGLKLIKRYVDLLGATVSLESSPDEGTTFVLTIPKQ